MNVEANISIKALVSPRFTRREASPGDSEDDFHTETDVRAGDIIIVNDAKNGNGKKAHMELVKDHLTLHANFYTDSSKSFQYGSLTVDKCKISLSSNDLRVIQLSKCKDDTFPSTGLLIKAKSEQDALQWMAVMSQWT